MARSRYVLRVSLRFFIFPLLLLHGLNLAAQQRPRGVHFMHGYPASHPPRESSAPLDLLNYYGGPVISNVRVIAVFWTSQVDAGEQANAPGFYSAVTNSPWMDLLAQYSTVGLSGFTGHPASNQTIGRGSFQGAITITPANHNTTLNDLAIRNELQHQISIGALPAPQPDSAGYPKTLYMVYFPLSITISDPGIGTSCVDFCAYHSNFTYNSKWPAYGVIPDLSPASACSFGCGNSPDYLSNLDSACSHELAEAVTDPAVGVAFDVDYPLAWYDPNPNDPFGGGEIGDLCIDSDATTTGNGQTYTVQTLWSNHDGGCVASRPIATTALALTFGTNPSTFGQSLTFTASITSTAGTPTGMVKFFDGDTLLATLTLDGSGQAMLTTTAMTPGTHSITAVYGGDANTLGSTSTVLSHTVQKATSATTVSLTSGVDPSTFAQSLTFTITVSPQFGLTPTGSVTLKDGAVALVTRALNGSAQAAIAVSSLSVGAHSITAVYGGDPNIGGSASSPPLSQTVNNGAGAATSVALTVSPNRAIFRTLVTYNATVSPATATGTVMFFDGATMVGSGTVSGGVATFSTNQLAIGQHAITASYGGDINFSGNSSPVVVFSRSPQPH